MLSLETRTYCRPFRVPLQTIHGTWDTRQGLILRFQDRDGNVTYGEIAPIPWFGTETLAQAQSFCAQWPRTFLQAQIADIPEYLSACQFGLGSQEWITRVDAANGHLAERGPLGPRDICALLPPGRAVLDTWSGLWAQGYRTFKWKIGLTPVEEEVQILQALVATLPATARLRLDANGGLSARVAEVWLIACDALGDVVEFIEQPLPPAHILDWLRHVNDRYMTAIALDESVATLRQLRDVYRLGHQVIYVVKPAIAGFPQQLFDFCLHHQIDVVLSSALETPVGRNIVWGLAHQLWAAGIPKRSVGFGIEHWFSDDWERLSEPELWERL